MYKLCVALAFLAVAAAKPNWPLAYNSAFTYPAGYSYPVVGSGLAYPASVVAETIAAPAVVAKTVATPAVIAPAVVAPAAPLIAKTVVADYPAPLINYPAVGAPLAPAYGAGIAPYAYSDVAPVSFILKKK